jgi:hypothetical protein
MSLVILSAKTIGTSELMEGNTIIIRGWKPNLPVPPNQLPASPRWSLAARIAFRFAIVYFGLSIFSFPVVVGFIPFTQTLFTWYSGVWKVVAPWVGLHFLHITHPMVMIPTGSEDRTFNWVQHLCFLVLASVATAIWSILDRKRVSYPSLYKWARVWIRLFLASMMFGYGAAKAFPVQMPGVALSRLLEPYGNFSPMGVLWTFMGSSKGYEITTGCVEILAGLLLIVPRTALLGALVAIISMSQVFLLNMFYDIPVKTFSFTLMLLGVFILAPDAVRLAKVFFLNQTAERSAEPPLFRRIWPNRMAIAVQVLLGLLLLGFNLSNSRQRYYTYSVGAPKSPLYGIWSVKEFSADGTVRPPLLTDESRWRNVIFEKHLGMFEIETMDEKFQYFRPKVDLAARSLVLEKFVRGMSKSKGPQEKDQFSIEQPTSGTLSMDGMYDGHQIHAELERVDETKFLLLSRGFHWVTEQGVNR